MVTVGEVDVGDSGSDVAAPVTHFALLEGGAATLGEAHLGAEVSVSAGGGQLEGAGAPLSAAGAHAPTPRAQHQPRPSSAHTAA